MLNLNVTHLTVHDEWFFYLKKCILQNQIPWVLAIKPILCVNILTVILGGPFNGWCYFSVKKSSHHEKKSQCFSSHWDARSRCNINHHFNLNSCSHGVKIEVKQVDLFYTWLCNENQYFYVELSDSVVDFTTFNLKVASVTRQLYPRHPVPKSVVSHSFSGIDIRVPPYIYFVWPKHTIKDSVVIDNTSNYF